MPCRLLPAALAVLAAAIAGPCLHDVVAQVVINEIMYAPLAPEPEWVELLNAGARDVKLADWSIEDASGGIAPLPEVVIPSGGYLLLTRDSTRLAKVRGAVRMAQLPLPSLNNGGDLLALRTSSGRVIDSVRWASSWGGTGGVSLERRLPESRSALAASWGSSTSPARATAGALNSITPVDHDLAVTDVRVDPIGARVTVTLLNNGLLPIPAATVLLAHDADLNGAIDAGEILAELPSPPLLPGDSTEIVLPWTRPITEEGEEGLAGVRADVDERSENDVISFEVTTVPPTGGVIISEIMYDPVAIDGAPGAEYVELYNPSRRSIPVVNWRLYDATGTSHGVVKVHATIAPLGYLLLATDTAIYRRFPWLRDSTNVLVTGPSSFGLNVEGDEVVIRSPIGETVDSVPYLDAWHRSDLTTTKGIALERISASAGSTLRENWSSSVARAGGTPAAPNSVAIPPTTARATMSVAPRIISPDADGRDDFTRISYRLPVPVSRLVVDILDREGRQTRRLESNMISGAEGELIWDGCADDGRPLDIGIYIIHLEAYDEGHGGTIEANATVIVARKLGE